MNTSFPAWRLFAVAALTFTVQAAQAQYVWIDANGIKQFSDRSPPASVPDKNILKTPGGQRDASFANDQARPSSREADPRRRDAPTLAERDAAFRKRAAEKSEQDKKAALEERARSEADQRCAAARDYKAQLDAGIRIGTVGKGGERGFMGDAERAAANTKVNKSLAGCR